MSDGKPVIIVKKKGGHGGHHGGAWKVAYADFVTAMMAFFMVMWLVNSAEVTTKQNIAQYFRRPGIFQEGSGTPLMLGQAGILNDAYVPNREIKKGIRGKKGLKDNKGGEPEGEVERILGEGKSKFHEYGKGTGKDKERGEGKFIEKSKAKEKALDKEYEKATNPDVIESTTPPGKDKTKEAKGDGQKGTEPTPGQQGDKQGGQPNVGNQGINTGPGAQDKALQESLAAQQRQFDQLASELKEKFASSPELAQMLGIVDIKVDADGLNIEIIDTDKTSMFASGSPVILPEARAAFTKIAQLILKLPNKIDIVGHTDAKPFASRRGGYSNWELSGDRANAARRILEENGIPAERIARVVGQADRELKFPQDPFNPSNRRITLKMRFAMNKTIKAQDLTAPELAEQVAAAPTPNLPLTPAEIKAAKEQETAHSFRPKEVIQAKKAENKRVVLPEEDAPASVNPGYMEKDKIFGDSPVLGPPTPFSGP